MRLPIPSDDVYVDEILKAIPKQDGTAALSYFEVKTFVAHLHLRNQRPRFYKVVCSHLLQLL